MPQRSSNNAALSKVQRLQNQIVPKKKRQSTRPKKSVSKLSTIRNSNISNPFTRALVDPFNPKSLGIQVPDPFPFPTTTYHTHQTNVIGTPTGSTIGSVLFLPNPIISMIDYTHLSNMVSGYNSVTATPMYQYGSVSTNSASALYGATSPNDLNAKFCDYRVVSWGLKITNLQPQLTATGRLIISHIPIGDEVPSVNSLTNATASTCADSITGLSVGTLMSSAPLQLPTVLEIAVCDLLHGDLEVSGMYTNSNYWTLKSTKNTPALVGATTMSSDEGLISNVNGAAVFSGLKDPTRCVGGCAISIYFEGMPAATANLFQVETIYHLEGTPQLSSSSDSSLVPSNMPKASIGSTIQVERSLCVASQPSSIFHFIRRGAEFINENSDAIGGAARLMLTLAQSI